MESGFKPGGIFYYKIGEIEQEVQMEGDFMLFLMRGVYGTIEEVTMKAIIFEIESKIEKIKKEYCI